MPGETAGGKSRGLQGENRKFPRRSIELPILYTFIGKIKTYGGETGNISEGGLLIYLKETLWEGMKLKIEIFPPDFFGFKPIKAVTQIVWAPAHQRKGWDEYLQHGLEFVDIDNENSIKLKHLLRYIGG